MIDELSHARSRKSSQAKLYISQFKREQPIRGRYTVGHWLDINSLEDVVQAGNF